MLVEPEQATPFIQFLRSRSAFFDYAVEHTSSEPVESPDWTPSDETFERFVDWVEAEGLATREEIDEALTEPGSREHARRLLRAEVLNAVFGLEARYRALAGGDNQIRKALALFDQAGALLARRKALESRGEERQVARLLALPGG